MPSRFTGTPETKIVKCYSCQEKMEYLTDGIVIPEEILNKHEKLNELNVCWDCLDNEKQNEPEE